MRASALYHLEVRVAYDSRPYHGRMSSDSANVLGTFLKACAAARINAMRRLT